MKEKNLEKFLAATALGLFIKGQMSVLMLPAPTVKPEPVKSEVVFLAQEKENVADKIWDFAGSYQVRVSSVAGTFTGSSGSIVAVIGLPIIPTL